MINGWKYCPPSLYIVAHLANGWYGDYLKTYFNGHFLFMPNHSHWKVLVWAMVGKKR